MSSPDDVRLHHVLDYSREAVAMVEHRARKNLDADRMLQVRRSGRPADELVYNRPAGRTGQDPAHHDRSADQTHRPRRRLRQPELVLPCFQRSHRPYAGPVSTAIPPLITPNFAPVAKRQTGHSALALLARRLVVPPMLSNARCLISAGFSESISFVLNWPAFPFRNEMERVTITKHGPAA